LKGKPVRIVDIHAAKSQLFPPVELAAAGEEIVITRDGRSVARLVPFAPLTARQTTKRRSFGRMRGMIHVADDFDEPLPDTDMQSEATTRRLPVLA
jgi:antitoxin (DNA-binding transcriptional repressor) of toxin-antitoxin stability system